MLNSIRNSRAVFATIFTLLLLAAGLYVTTAAYAQSGLTIVVDHVDGDGWRAHIEGTCPEGYELKTRNLEGRWGENQSGVTVRAHCLRVIDGFECWHVTKWIRNPSYVAPTKTPLPEGVPTATPRPPQPTPTPCPECLVPTPTGLPATTPELPTATPVETTIAPGAPPATPEIPGEAPDVGEQPEAPSAPGPCPNNPNGMPARWVLRDGREEPVCEETSSVPAPAPAAAVTGYSIIRDDVVVAHFDVSLVQGEVARAEYVFSDGTREIILNEPFSPDEERRPLPSPLEVEVPPGQTVVLSLTVVGYDDSVTVSSNAVESRDATVPMPQESATMPRAATTNGAQPVIVPKLLPRTGGEIDEYEAFWQLYGHLMAACSIALIVFGMGLRFVLTQRSRQ